MVNVKKHVNNSLVPFSKIQCLEIVAACLFTFVGGVANVPEIEKKKRITTLNKTLKKQVT